MRDHAYILVRVKTHVMLITILMYLLMTHTWSSCIESEEQMVFLGGYPVKYWSPSFVCAPVRWVNVSVCCSVRYLIKRLLTCFDRYVLGNAASSNYRKTRAQRVSKSATNYHTYHFLNTVIKILVQQRLQLVIFQSRIHQLWKVMLFIKIEFDLHALRCSCRFELKLLKQHK